MRINENQKITLTVGQIKRLVREGSDYVQTKCKNYTRDELDDFAMKYVDLLSKGVKKYSSFTDTLEGFIRYVWGGRARLTDDQVRYARSALRRAAEAMDSNRNYERVFHVVG